MARRKTANESSPAISTPVEIHRACFDIVEQAHERGWMACPNHSPRAGDRAGFPDVTLARGDKLHFVFLVSRQGYMTHEQLAWNRALTANGAPTIATRATASVKALLDALDEGETGAPLVTSVAGVFPKEGDGTYTLAAR